MKIDKTQMELLRMFAGGERIAITQLSNYYRWVNAGRSLVEAELIYDVDANSIFRYYEITDAGKELLNK